MKAFTYIDSIEFCKLSSLGITSANIEETKAKIIYRNRCKFKMRLFDIDRELSEAAAKLIEAKKLNLKLSRQTCGLLWRIPLFKSIKLKKLSESYLALEQCKRDYRCLIEIRNSMK